MSHEPRIEIDPVCGDERKGEGVEGRQENSRERL
jgi:hypothetical protein